MGEVNIANYPVMLRYTRKFIRLLVTSGIHGVSDYMKLCIAVVQYLCLLHADSTRKVSRFNSQSYMAFPRKYVDKLADAYKVLANDLITDRNTICHNIGSPAYITIVQQYSDRLTNLENFVEDVIMNDRLIEKDTLQKMAEQ